MKENSIKDIIEEKYTRYLNCETDIIGLTLEEAKFILETGERRNYVTSILQEAVKVLLSDYKRVLKENEELLELKVSASAHNRILELEKENKELQKEIDQMKSLDIYKLVEDWETGQFIPVQKVKDKIEELKKKVEELTDDKGYWGGSDLLEQIKVLQELLEKEK